MSALWMLLPDEAMILVIAGIGLALILGLINRKAAMGIMGTIILSLLLAPFLDSLFQLLPLWLLLLILFAVGISLFRGIASLFLGDRAASHMIGILAADCIKFFFRMLFFPFRFVYWIFRRV
jgi:hypothetical protein